jgi:hypothetical protein
LPPRICDISPSPILPADGTLSSDQNYLPLKPPIQCIPLKETGRHATREVASNDKANVFLGFCRNDGLFHRLWKPNLPEVTGRTGSVAAAGQTDRCSRPGRSIGNKTANRRHCGKRKTGSASSSNASGPVMRSLLLVLNGKSISLTALRRPSTTARKPSVSRRYAPIQNKYRAKSAASRKPKHTQQPAF